MLWEVRKLIGSVSSALNQENNTSYLKDPIEYFSTMDFLDFSAFLDGFIEVVAVSSPLCRLCLF
jgi:hypothetical protein